MKHRNSRILAMLTLAEKGKQQVFKLYEGRYLFVTRGGKGWVNWHHSWLGFWDDRRDVEVKEDDDWFREGKDIKYLVDLWTK